LSGNREALFAKIAKDLLKKTVLKLGRKKKSRTFVSAISNNAYPTKARGRSRIKKRSDEK